METITEIGYMIDALMVLIPKIIALCSVIAAIFPPPRRRGPMKTLYRIVNYAAFNVKYAENGHGNK